MPSRVQGKSKIVPEVKLITRCAAPPVEKNSKTFVAPPVVDKYWTPLSSGDHCRATALPRSSNGEIRYNFRLLLMNAAQLPSGGQSDVTTSSAIFVPFLAVGIKPREFDRSPTARLFLDAVVGDGLADEGVGVRHGAAMLGRHLRQVNDRGRLGRL